MLAWQDVPAMGIANIDNDAHLWGLGDWDLAVPKQTPEHATGPGICRMGASLLDGGQIQTTPVRHCPQNTRPWYLSQYNLERLLKTPSFRQSLGFYVLLGETSFLWSADILHLTEKLSVQFISARWRHCSLGLGGSCWFLPVAKACPWYG